VSEVRQAVHHDLEWNSYLLFDLFSGAARPLCNYLNIVVGDIRISFDRQDFEGDDAPDKPRTASANTRIRFASAKSTSLRIMSG
jgi:hypothetical protein